MFRSFHDRSEAIFWLVMEKRTHDDAALEQSILDLFDVYIPVDLVRVALKDPSDPLGQLYDLNRAKRLLAADSARGSFRVRDEATYQAYVQRRWWKRWFRRDWEAAHRLMKKNGHLLTVVTA
ncbi:hypothetical protein NB700_001813 [Xanthomonas sacchari]|uniref:Transposase n=1 Tax=Xanthomonas sacchari TaxID=56458 RepID=A0ABT3DUV1_9XANT|nr:hypothetical protein [Xanthomonas sacchari]MCW0399257.1 hypothetical protein [Xanthomonas sacchari]